VGGSGDRVETLEATTNSSMPSRLVIGAGVLLELISLFANPSGLGKSPDLGWRQTLGVVIGGLIVLVGVYLWGRGKGVS
jgi:hypothetical protein